MIVLPEMIVVSFAGSLMKRGRSVSSEELDVKLALKTLAILP